jgi:hypothetical protein
VHLHVVIYLSRASASVFRVRLYNYTIHRNTPQRTKFAQFRHNSRAKRNSIACLYYSHSIPFARFGFAVSPIHIAVSIHIDTLSAILFGSLTLFCVTYFHTHTYFFYISAILSHYSHYFRVYTIHATSSVANSFCSIIIDSCIYLTRTLLVRSQSRLQFGLSIIRASIGNSLFTHLRHLLD